MQETTDTSSKPHKYWAFISYSSKDSRWGKWLIQAIEKYRIPKSLVGLKTGPGTIPSRLYPIFRDRDELRAGADVGEALDDALSQSRCLVVVCSPNSADPESWVNTEITSFKAMGRERDVLALIVAGEPMASDRPGSEGDECFPVALRYTVDASGQLTSERTEPLAADLTREDENSRASRRKALLKLIAHMIDVDFDVLEQRDRRRRRQKTAVWSAVGLSLFIAFAGLASLWLEATRVSASQELAKQAKEKIATEKDLGALLGLHAYRMYPTPAAYDALLTTPSENPNLVTFLHRGVSVSAVAQSSDNRLAAVADCGNANCELREIHLYDQETLQHTVDPVRVDTKNITEMAFHPNGERLFIVASGEKFHQLLALDVNQPESPATRLYRDRSPITSMSISDDGRFYSVAMEGGEFKVFGSRGRKCGGFLEPRIILSTFSSDGGQFAAGSEEGEILLVEIATCKTHQLNLGERLGALTFASGGERLTAIMLDGTVTEWDVASRRALDHFNATPFMLNGFLHAFSRDSMFLASKHDSEIRLFDLAKHRSLAEFLREEPSDSYLAHQAREEMRNLQVAILRGHVGSPRLIRFSPDGNTLISVDDRESVILWDVQGKPLEVVDDHEISNEEPDTRKTNAVSADERFYATVREETEGCEGDFTWDCKRWIMLTLTDTATNLEIKTLVTGGDASPVPKELWINFSEEGKVIIRRGMSQMLWHVDPPHLIERACRMANRPLSAAEINEYLGWRRWLAGDGATGSCQIEK